MKKGSCYTLVYAGVLGSVCALLLTAASSFTAPYRLANADAEMKRNILDVLAVRYPPDASSEQLLEIFTDRVKQEGPGELTLYRYIPPEGSDEVERLAVAFEGPGLWGPIKGFLALGSDLKTIRGLTFYEQEETPGLGGEIASQFFLSQFEGKKIMDEAGNVGIKIKSGGPSAVNRVDAITGATMTCDKVEAILNEAARKIAKEFGKEDGK
ncbi:MAG TPA: FMN-binding protein [Planctomycetes bacterium]|nr:FMN-binding protein [Planctomycetota bacterium]